MKSQLLLITLLVYAAMAAATAIGFYLKEELIWGLAIGFSVFYLLLLPAIYVRKKNLGRFNPAEALGSFSYSTSETQLVAATILDWQKRRNRWIAPFTAGCLGFMGVIFLVVLHTQFPEVPLWQWLWLLLPTALPYLLRAVYFFYLKRLVLKEPCTTVIGRNFLKWGNTTPVFNEREALNATDASLINENGRYYVEVLYRSITRMRYGGKVEHRDRVKLLVPLGFERMAQDLVGEIRRGKEKK